MPFKSSTSAKLAGSVLSGNVLSRATPAAAAGAVGAAGRALSLAGRTVASSLKSSSSGSIGSSGEKNIQPASSATLGSGFQSRQFTTSAAVESSSSGSSSAVRLLALRRLSSLSLDADRNPSSAVKQLVYYKELNKVGRYSEVIQRVESGKYSTDTSCLQLYVESLVKIGKSDQILQRVGLLAQKEPHLLDQMAKFVDESSLADIGKATANMPSQSFASSSATSSSSSSMQNIDRDQNGSFTDSLSNIFKQNSNENESSSGSNSNEIQQPVRVIVENPQQTPLIWRVLSWIGSTFVYLFVALTFMNILLENSGLIKSAQSTTPNEFQPGTGSGDRVTFSDVQGCDEAKQELEELVEFLKDPKRFTELGGRMPKGVLLTGPPGTGKTLLARAVAGEAGVPFFFMAGSEFDEVYVGLGAKRIRELFAAARRKSPSIVFIDELDAIGAKRSAKDQTYIKQTLNQLLVDLDGFSPSEGVIFIAATNFPEMLDKALVRPGRFDRHVNVPLPDVRGRIQILSLHTKNVPLDPTVDISVIARGTPGFSGADLANLVNHAAIQASRDGSRTVLMRHLDFAKDKILMGAERRSAVVTAESKRRTAYHEGGHALMALRTQGAIPLHKATVMPRGMSLGMTVQLPELDKDSYTRQEYLAMIDVSMGGRIAEELIYGVDHASSGAHNDLQKATQIATQMVTQFGMDETVGLISYSDEERQLLSTPTKQRIEDAIKRLLHESRERTINCLNEHRDDLERLATGLIEFETLSREEIDAILRGERINGGTLVPRPVVNGKSASPSHPSSESPESGSAKKPIPATIPTPTPAGGKRGLLN